MILLWGGGFAFIALVCFLFLIERRLRAILAHYRRRIAGEPLADLPEVGFGRRWITLLNDALGSRSRRDRLARLATRSLAHDLRTPLARIRTTLEQMQLSTHEDIDRAGYSLEQIERLNQTIARLMLFIRLDDRRSLRALEPMSLSDLVSSLAEDYEFVLEDAGIQWHTDIEADIQIYGLPDLLQQALINVVENALKYGVAESDPRFEMSVTKDAGFAVVHFRDNGPGIPEVDLARIQRPFEQQSKHAATGGGLGLSLVEGIVDVHNGVIELRNAKSGLLLDVRLPLLEDAG